MALSKTMNAKLNEQITSEFYSSQVYLAMACMFEEMGLKMLAKLYRKQTEEEREHALKILDFIPSVEGKVKLQAIPEPPAQYPSVLAAIEAALEHERTVTKQINELVALADEEKDYATRSFLNWYVDEQVEEVQSQAQLAQIAKMVGNNLVQLEAYVAHLVN
jgi:ferritin